MDLLLMPVPLFDKNISVEAYMFRYWLPAAELFSYDATSSIICSALNEVGIDAFTGRKTLFVPVFSQMLLAELDRQCRQPPDSIVFLIEDQVPPDEKYISSIVLLRKKGFRFAVFTDPYESIPNALLRVMDFLLLDKYDMAHPDRKARILRYKKAAPSIGIIATGLDCENDFYQLIEEKADLYEGRFYCNPVELNETEIKPLKANLIHLLNIVRDENFEFDTIAGIVMRDPALTLSLMRFVNSPWLGVRHKIKTIHHAVTILGQIEVRKWVTAAALRSLASERPSELVRLCLVRARLAENLAPLFGLSKHAQSLFLMGLFSTMDVILQTPLKTALDSLSLSDDIRDSLVGGTGPYHIVMDLIQSYEKADWYNVVRICGDHTLAIEAVYTSYMNSVSWYNDLLFDKVRPLRK